MNFSRLLLKCILLFLLSSLLTDKYTKACISFLDPQEQVSSSEKIILPVDYPKSYKNLIIDSNNLIFLSSDNTVMITDGLNYQKLQIPGSPIICKNDLGNIGIAGRNYLVILSKRLINGYTINTVIDSTSIVKYGNITSIGFKNNDLIFTNNTKVWKYDGKNILSIDSSNHDLKTVERNNKTTQSLDLYNFGEPKTKDLIGIYTADNITYFGLTPTRIWRFLNPSFVKTITNKQIADQLNLYENQLSVFVQDGKNLLKPIGFSYSGDTIYISNSNQNRDPISLFIKNVDDKAIKTAQLLVFPFGSAIRSAYLDQDSNLAISTSDEYLQISNQLFQNKLNKRKHVVQIFTITSFKRDYKKVIFYGFADFNKDSLIKIDNGSSIEFILSGYDPIFWNSLNYSVILRGHNKSWSEWSTDNRYLFFDLKPGKYDFIVKSKNPMGEQLEDKLITINVVPPFYQTNFAYISLFVLLLLMAYATLEWRSYYHAKDKFLLENLINKRTDELVKEKEKTENLLARVLPRETANELKETGKVSTQRFNVVTVLFSDIQGFTRITDETNPEVLIDQLDKFFLYFDSVVEKYKIEKIKTIGDAYMCAGGIPQKNRTNPVEVVLAAFEMMFFMKELNKQHKFGFDLWDLRIGIDTGPVIAGVVGRKKLTYDIWGSTVNTASRMESSGEIGKINISGNTYILVKEYFNCTYRGKMPIKNKGDIEMYFVDGIKPEFSENFAGIKPNRDFEIQLQILRLGDLEELILDKLDIGLPKNLYYHNLKHTVDVYTQVELIGKSENVTKEELLLLRTAALFHDSGQMIDYDTHEEMGVKLAREILPEYQYTERQIEIISELIMATKMPPRPKNILEAIICDADLDYLGRTDFIPVSNMLYKELHEHGKIGAMHEWNELQMKFIEKHQYFTNTARRLRNVNKKSQLDNIKQWIEKNNL